MAILKDLIVHGSSRFLNKIYADELETSAFEADSAVIKKLKADEATVVGLLDVQGQLHTNTWTNSNIATIDGCFYITPTLSSDSGKISFSSTSVASLTGTYAAVTSLYIGDSSSGSTVQWTKDSKVLLTGEVQVNGQWLPLGTLLGTLSANATTSSIGLTGLTDNRHNTSSIITDIRNAVSNTSLNYRNLKISLYQRKDGTDSKPLGIYMTAMGTNGKTFIDIYGGVNATTTAGSSGGFADPNLRIGNLSGLGAVEGTTPTGWGIYTTNGYFKGVIVSSAGKIGNFTINSALYSNNHSAWNSNVSGIYINNDGISGGAGGKWWLWNDGSAKIGAMTLSAAGVLTVPAANVSGELTAATINGSKISAGDIAAARIQTNLISAINAKVSDISALTATLGGFQVDNTAIHTKNVEITSNADNSIALSSADFTRTINSTSRAGLRFAIGDKLGITGDGAIYASSATISGNITATSLTLGSGVTIGYSSISNPPTIPTTVAQLTDSGSYLTTTAAASTYATTTAVNNAAGTASKYISVIDQNGIKVHAENNKNLNYTKISSQAIIMYQNGNDVMNLKTNQFRIGTNTGNNIKIDTNGITINNGSTQVASYKDSIILGDEANNNLLFLDKSSLSLRSGVEDYLSGNEVFEVGECAETISKTVTSGQASYQWSELTNNTKELKEVTLNGELLEEGVDYTFNLTTGTVTLTNAPTNSTAKLKVSFIPMNPEVIQKTITFTTPEEEYWLLRSLYAVPQHVTNIFSISLNGTVLTSSQYSYNSSTHILSIPATPTANNAPAAGSTVEIVYTKSLGYYYTLGKRDLTKIGDYSIATGYNCMAAGDKSFAGGNYTYVTGQSSFGYGYGTSDADCVAISGDYCGGIGRGISVRGTGNFGCGNYNVPSSSYIFSVGNGSSTTDRKNAFWVAKSGNARVAGNLSVMSGIQVAGQMRSYRKDGSGTVPLFWYGTKRKSNISISANNANSGLTCDITLPNYTPMGVVGMRILNSSSSGTNAQYCNLYIYMIVNNSSEDHITFSIKNSASTAAKVDVEFKIFYIANEALSNQIDWS